MTLSLKLIHEHFLCLARRVRGKETALRNFSEFHKAEADSILPMGINNETLKYVADNHCIIYGHVGALSAAAAAQLVRVFAAAVECTAVWGNFRHIRGLALNGVQPVAPRQELHERIRQHSLEAGKNVKDRGLNNNLIDLIAEDPMFGLTRCIPRPPSGWSTT